VGSGSNEAQPHAKAGVSKAFSDTMFGARCSAVAARRTLAVPTMLVPELSSLHGCSSLDREGLPMTTPRPPGWYDDANDPNAQRYWDGQQWTPHRQRKSTARPTPPPPRQPPPPRNPPLAPARRPPAPAGPTQQVHSPTPPPPHRASTPNGSAARLSSAGWLLLGGLVIAIVAIFLPFATVSINLFGFTLRAHEVSAGGTARIVVVLLVAVAVGLAWPTPSGSRMAVARLTGLSVVVVLFIVVAVVAYLDVSENNGKGEGIVKVSPAFGLLLYGAGVLVIAAAVVWLWTDRSRGQRQAS
jgi:hypothetical protein